MIVNILEIYTKTLTVIGLFILGPMRNPVRRFVERRSYNPGNLSWNK